MFKVAAFRKGLSGSVTYFSSIAFSFFANLWPSGAGAQRSKGCVYMTFVLVGCLAFVFLFLFDLNKIRFRSKSLNLCFAVSVAMLAFSTIGILVGDYQSMAVYGPWKIIFCTLAAVSLILMFYSLFFAIPFNDSYVEAGGGNSVVDTGMYALCRHPGVVWFFFFYLFLWLASGKKMMLWAGFIWTLMDVFHVYLQDRWFFPATLEGYDVYKRTTPFLIPNLNSIRRSLTTFQKRITPAEKCNREYPQ